LNKTELTILLGLGSAKVEARIPIIEESENFRVLREMNLSDMNIGLTSSENA